MTAETPDVEEVAEVLDNLDDEVDRLARDNALGPIGLLASASDMIERLADALGLDVEGSRR